MCVLCDMFVFNVYACHSKYLYYDRIIDSGGLSSSHVADIIALAKKEGGAF